jgi:hypothetical protein
VTVEIVGGEAFDAEGAPVQQAALTTNDQGVASWRFQMKDHAPLRARISVPSASLATTVWINAEQ